MHKTAEVVPFSRQTANVTAAWWQYPSLSSIFRQCVGYDGTETARRHSVTLTSVLSLSL